jgi:thiamine biosynthesis lipoprotein
MPKKLFLISLISIFFISCNHANKNQIKSSESFTAMNTYMTVSLYASSQKQGAEVCEKIKKRIIQLEEILSTTLPQSDVYYINHNKKLPSPLKAELSELLDFSKIMYEKTDAAYNPALYPLIREWGFTQGEYKVPSEEKIAELLLHTDFSKLCDWPCTNGASINSQMEIDFGAIGKGYAADQVQKLLEENGIESALLDLGGNIQVLGKKPDKSFWRVGIKNPWNGEAACALKVDSKAVVTSGGYERFFEEDGKRYIHIFDSKTGRPVESDLESVTIITPVTSINPIISGGKYADCLSTALFVMGKDRAIDYWKKNPDFDFILITKEKALIYSEGLKDSIEILYHFDSLEYVQKD